MYWPKHEAARNLEPLRYRTIASIFWAGGFVDRNVDDLGRNALAGFLN